MLGYLGDIDIFVRGEDLSRPSTSSGQAEAPFDKLRTRPSTQRWGITSINKFQEFESGNQELRKIDKKFLLRKTRNTRKFLISLDG